MNIPVIAYLPVVAGIIGGLIGGRIYRQHKSREKKTIHVMHDVQKKFENDI